MDEHDPHLAAKSDTPENGPVTPAEKKTVPNDQNLPRLLGMLALFFVGSVLYVLLFESKMQGDSIMESLSLLDWKVVLAQGFFYSSIVFAIYHIYNRRKQMQAEKEG